MIAATQFSFSLSLASYITATMKTVIKTIFDYNIDIWYIAVVMMCILIPIAWVRQISKFSFTFLVGNILILTTVIIVTIVLIVKFVKRDYEFADNLEPINMDSYMSMVGFSCYAYEGIGVVMPIMENCDCPEKFDKILFAAILTLTIIYILYAEWCLLIYGDELTKTFIT